MELALPKWGTSQGLNPQLDLMMRALARFRGLSCDNTSNRSSETPGAGATGLVRAMAPSLAPSSLGRQTCKLSIVLVLLDTDSCTAAAAARTHVACLIGGRMRAAALGHDPDRQIPLNTISVAKGHFHTEQQGSDFDDFG